MSLRFLGWLLIVPINILIIVLVIRMFLSWFSLPYNKHLEMLYKFTDPFLDRWRKIFPLRIGFLDLSAMVLVIVLVLCGNVINDILIEQLPLNFVYIIMFILNIIKAVLDIIFFGMAVSVVVLMIFNLVAQHTFNPVVSLLRSFIDPIIFKIRRIVRINNKYADIIYLGIVLLAIILLSVVVGYFYVIAKDSLYRLN